MGYVDNPTWDKKKYYVTFLDDCTHFYMVYLIQFKSEYNQEYIAEVESKWNWRVHSIRCDNDEEFINEDLKNWAKIKGVLLNVTVDLNLMAQQSVLTGLLWIKHELYYLIQT